jgi:hypothetical protein
MAGSIIAASEFRSSQAIEHSETAVQVLGHRHSGLTTSQVQTLSNKAKLSEHIQTGTHNAGPIQTAIANAGHGRAAIQGPSSPGQLIVQFGLPGKQR